MAVKNALDKLKGKIATTYQSSFDFESYEIDDFSKQIIIENEAVIKSQFTNYSESLYKMCSALYKVSLVMKKEGSFMSWYQHIGLSKDKVSELLKRNELYMQFPDKALYVSSLSIQAVKILTGKSISLEQQYDVADLELKKVDEIKSYLHIENKIDSMPCDEVEEAVVVDSVELSSNMDFEIDFFKKIQSVDRAKDFIKNTTSMDELKSKMRTIATLRRQAAELEKLFQERLDTLAQDNNMRMFYEG